MALADDGTGSRPVGAAVPRRMSYVVEPRERRMRTDGTAHGQPAPDGQDARDVLRRSAWDVLDVAEGIRAVSARTGAVLCAPALTASARRHRRTGLAARWALLRALTHRRGLGGSARPVSLGMGHLFGAAGQALGRESLAALASVTALRLRVAAVLVDHPELVRDPGMRRLTAAVATDRDTDAVRALRALFRDQGARRALSGLAPLMTELHDLRALLGEPKKGGSGRAAAAGPEPSVVPSPATDASPRAGEGAAEAVDLTEQERQVVATEGSLLGYLRNIEVLSADGRILVQNVRGPDGVVRYVVQVPGRTPGRPHDDSPQDFAGTWRTLTPAGSPYTRSLLPALRDYGIPQGAELALIGHGEGGTALLDLARDEEFCRTYRVTHVVAVGSPVGDEKPADPRTWVAGVSNQHDILAVPDGHGTGLPPAPLPHRYEVVYPGPTREFPQAHLLRSYIEHLRTVVPEAREIVDEALTPYRGPIVRTQAYRLRNRAHPPEGHPFLTLPTNSLPTTAGPVDVPVRYHDSSAAHLCYAVDAVAARGLLPDVPWTTPSRLGRRALAVLSLYEHRCSTIGPYTEVALSVAVHDLWRPHRHDIAVDLLRRADLRRTGRYVVALAVSSDEARVVAQEIWGQPAMRMTAETDLTGRRIAVRSPDLGLTVEGRLGPGVRGPETDWVLYGRRGESTVRTLVRAHGRPRLHPGTGVRLRLDTAAAEPLAGALRRLGIQTARPLFVLTCPSFMAHRSAGAPLPR
ncbi:acetoacetate decarboxylase family protein [Streptomyces sp. NPDC052301]|uniref:acetoacetate decarboxylase family protein n=1 Tax=Streptomyces sp. NPDC052301 TaxID=3365687 RepID=UPI0037D403D8